MKLSLRHLLLLSAITLASQSSLALAEEAVVTSDAAEAKVEETVEGYAAAAAVGEGEGEGEGDAGKECAADDGSCAPPADPEEEAAQDYAPPAELEDKGDVDHDCPPSRPHVIACAAKYLDTNRNGALEREELESAILGVNWLLRNLLKVIGSVDSIMKKCDADGDGKITIEEDMEATKETCLATCFKRKVFKNLFFPECTE